MAFDAEARVLRSCTRHGSRRAQASALVLKVLLAAAGGGSTTAYAQDTAFHPSDLGIRGRLIYKNFSHFQEVAGEAHVRNEGILQLKWQRQLTPWSRFLITTEFRGDDGDFARDVHFRIPDRAKNRSYVDLKEVALRIKTRLARLTLGKQIFAWGTADTFSPIDNINPYDWLDPLDGYKMAVWSANARARFDRVNLQVVIVPPFTPSRLPRFDGRWVFGIGNLLPGVDLRSLNIVQEFPETNLDTVQYAIRAKATVTGWDIAVTYYDGRDDTPDVNIPRGALGTQLRSGTLTLFNPRIRVPGLALSTTVGKFELHGEAVAIFQEGAGRGDRSQWVVGLNYRFDDFQLEWLEHIFFIVEYFRVHDLSGQGQRRFAGLGLYTDAFANSLANRIAFKFSEETQFDIFGTVNFEATPSYFLRPKLVHKLTDDLHLAMGFDLMGGNNQTFWGRWDDNDRFFTSLTYFF